MYTWRPMDPSAIMTWAWKVSIMGEWGLGYRQLLGSFYGRITSEVASWNKRGRGQDINWTKRKGYKIKLTLWIRRCLWKGHLFVKECLSWFSVIQWGFADSWLVGFCFCFCFCSFGIQNQEERGRIPPSRVWGEFFNVLEDPQGRWERQMGMGRWVLRNASVCVSHYGVWET